MCDCQTGAVLVCGRGIAVLSRFRRGGRYNCLAAAIHAAHAAGCCKLEIRKEPLNAAVHSRRIGTCLFNQDGEIMQINCLLRQSTLPGQAE